MTRSGRLLKIIGITLAALILCLWLANELHASHSRRVAESAVAAVQQFSLNKTTITEAETRLQAATSQRVTPTVDAEGNKQIEYSLVVPQGGLMRLGRIFWFSITLKFDSGDRLTSKRLLFTSNSYACCTAEVWELAALAGRETSEFQVARYDPYSIIVHFGPNASVVESQTAWNWQLSCLTDVAGCNDAREVLPSLQPPRRTQ